MAIFPLLPGISARILINGAPSTEYPDPSPLKNTHPDPLIKQHQELRTVSTYIPSIDNQLFSVELSVGPPYGCARMEATKLGFHVSVDGNEVWKATCARPFFKTANGQGGPRGEGKVWTEEVTGVKTGKGAKCVQRDFKFRSISTNAVDVEAENVRRIRQGLKQVGLIEIKVYRENYGRRGGSTPGIPKSFLSKEKRAVLEQALKGESKSHCTSLEAAKKVKRGEIWSAQKNDGVDRPHIIFRFMYRSEGSLKELGIIPRTPLSSPSPSPSRSPTPSPDLLPPADLEETLANRRPRAEIMKQIQRLNAQLKALNSAAAAPPATRKRPLTQKEIKKERLDEEKRLGRAAKRRRNLAGRNIEVIELSD